MTFLTAKFIIMVWGLGFAGSFVIQSVFQRWFAKNSHWGSNVGWQNEIAIWNLGVLVVLVGVLRSNANIESYVLPGLAVLSLFFGINHAVAVLRSPRSLSNWAGVISNTLGIVLYGIYLVISG